jgi:hypothetical protein
MLMMFEIYLGFAEHGDQYSYNSDIFPFFIHFLPSYVTTIENLLSNFQILVSIFLVDLNFYSILPVYINYQLYPQAILVVHSTGSGKSAIPLTHAIADGGVTIILENTLTLATDQHSKIENLQSDNVFSFHLDTVKMNDDKKTTFTKQSVVATL